jgi:hypothetical protein
LKRKTLLALAALLAMHARQPVNAAQSQFIGKSPGAPQALPVSSTRTAESVSQLSIAPIHARVENSTNGLKYESEDNAKTWSGGQQPPFRMSIGLFENADGSRSLDSMIVNGSPYMAWTGASYSLYEKEEGGWRLLNGGMRWTGGREPIAPGEYLRQSANITYYSLRAGTYRIERKIDVEGPSRGFLFTSEFHILSNPKDSVAGSVRLKVEGPNGDTYYSIDNGKTWEGKKPEIWVSLFEKSLSLDSKALEFEAHNQSGAWIDLEKAYTWSFLTKWGEWRRVNLSMEFSEEAYRVRPLSKFSLSSRFSEYALCAGAYQITRKARLASGGTAIFTMEFELKANGPDSPGGPAKISAQNPDGSYSESYDSGKTWKGPTPEVFMSIEIASAASDASAFENTLTNGTSEIVLASKAFALEHWRSGAWTEVLIRDSGQDYSIQPNSSFSIGSRLGGVYLSEGIYRVTRTATGVQGNVYTLATEFRLEDKRASGGSALSGTESVDALANSNESESKIGEDPLDVGSALESSTGAPERESEYSPPFGKSPIPPSEVTVEVVDESTGRMNLSFNNGNTWESSRPDFYMCLYIEPFSAGALSIENVIFNESPCLALMGRDFGMFRYENGAWEKVDTRLRKTNDAYAVQPGASFTMGATLSGLDLASGTYKIARTAFLSEDGKERTLRMETRFELRDRASARSEEGSIAGMDSGAGNSGGSGGSNVDSAHGGGIGMESYFSPDELYSKIEEGKTEIWAVQAGSGKESVSRDKGTTWSGGTPPIYMSCEQSVKAGAASIQLSLTNSQAEKTAEASAAVRVFALSNGTWRYLGEVGRAGAPPLSVGSLSTKAEGISLSNFEIKEGLYRITRAARLEGEENSWTLSTEFAVSKPQKPD